MPNLRRLLVASGLALQLVHRLVINAGQQRLTPADGDLARELAVDALPTQLPPPAAEVVRAVDLGSRFKCAP